MGLPICTESCGHLVFIDRVLLLNDHEGLRSVIGAKGSAAMKTVLSLLECSQLGTRIVHQAIQIFQRCRRPSLLRQTDEGLMDIRKSFRHVRNQKGEEGCRDHVRAGTLTTWKSQR